MFGSSSFQNYHIFTCTYMNRVHDRMFFTYKMPFVLLLAAVILEEIKKKEKKNIFFSTNVTSKTIVKWNEIWLPSKSNIYSNTYSIYEIIYVHSYVIE